MLLFLLFILITMNIEQVIRYDRMTPHIHPRWTMKILRLMHRY